MRALPGCPATTRGGLSVFLGRIVVAEISLVFQVASSGSKAISRERNSAQPYRRIFASYSRKDLDVVREFERYAEWIGDQYLRDVVQLRTGELWNDGLKRLIDQAQVFQLFWSSNSMNSPNVEEEWRYATSLQRPNFIRPVYWEDPMPETSDHSKPPQELRRLHFHRVEVKLPKDVEPRQPSAVAELERLLAEQRKREAAEQERLATEKKQREAAEKARKNQEREAAEKARKAKEEREAAEKARKAQADREAAEKARKAQQERDAAEKARKAKEEREAAEKARKAQQEREAAEREAQRQQEVEWQRLAAEVQQREAERQRIAEEQSRAAAAASSQTGPATAAPSVVELPPAPTREAFTPVPTDAPAPTREEPVADVPLVKRRTTWILAAAAVVVLGVGGAMWLKPGPGPTTDSGQATGATGTTGASQSAAVQLAVDQPTLVVDYKRGQPFPQRRLKVTVTPATPVHVTVAEGSPWLEARFDENTSSVAVSFRVVGLAFGRSYQGSIEISAGSAPAVKVPVTFRPLQ